MAKLVLSQNDRILVHLSELDRYRDEPEVPLAASQEGIAQRLDTQVFNASRALSSLEAEGLVFDRLAHVRGAPKRRRAYFLTDKGRTAAQAVRSDVGKRKIVIEHAGKAQELLVEEAIRKLTMIVGRPVSFSDTVELGRQFDTVVSSALSPPAETSLVLEEFAHRSHGRPRVELFFGRDNELKSIADSISNLDTPAILVWGMPGIGKSTLASKLYDGLLGKRPLFWYSFREWDSEASFLATISDFLLAVGRNDTAQAIKREAARSELFLPLANDLTDARVVLFLDDVQKPEKDLSSLLQILVEAVKLSGNSKIVLISRSIPSFFSKTAVGNIAVELAGLDRDSAWKLAQSLSPGDSIRLADESHGHPLLLNLMARGGARQAKGDVVSYIEGEVFSALSDQERHVLELLSIFRHPVPVEALGEYGHRTISSLRRRALVFEQEEGIWTHDLLREFSSSRMTGQNKSTLHRAAADYCGRQEGAEWSLETLYHLVKAGEWETACRTAGTHAVELAKEFPQETLILLSKLKLESVAPAETAEVLFVRGQLNDTLGHHEAALADFEASLSLLGEGDTGKKALVLEMLAKLQEQEQRWNESLAGHRKALLAYEKAGDKSGQAREWMNIGSVRRRKGDFNKAKEAYDEAMRLSTLEEDRPAQAACMNNMALLDWDIGGTSVAEAGLKQAVSLAHAVKDYVGEALGLENLAELLKFLGRLSEAATVFMEASEAFKKSGDLSEFKRLQAACAETLGLLGRYADGVKICEKAFASPELRRRKGLFQKSARYDSGDIALSSALVELLRASGDLKRAQRELARYASIVDSMDDPVLKARGKLMLAIVKEDSGDLDGASVALAEAEAILRSAGSHEGLIAVHMKGGEISEKMEDEVAARRHYEEAARHAEMAGNKYALKLARENLASLIKR